MPRYILTSNNEPIATSEDLDSLKVHAEESMMMIAATPIHEDWVERQDFCFRSYRKAGEDVHFFIHTAKEG